MAGTYQCPSCGDGPIESIKALKAHMTSAHGGYSDDDIRTASGSGSEAMFASGEQSFDEFASTLPDDPEELLNPPPSEKERVAEEQKIQQKELKTARVAMSKKMKKKMEAFKAKISETLPGLFFNRMAAKYDQPGWKLSDDEAEAVKDSVETALDMLDIEFAFQPIEITLTSIWWVVLYPVTVFGTIFLMKSSEFPIAKPPDEEVK